MERRWKRLLAGAAVVGVPAAVNAMIAARRQAPEAVLEGESRDYNWSWGRIHYRMQGSGRPLLLVHGAYAGASNYEWRHNFEALAQSYKVYAPDLLGFGRSEKPDVPYSANLYVRLIEDFLKDVIGEPCYVVGSSLGAAFCVAANRIVPLADKMALICPAGITHLRDPKSLMGRTLDCMFGTPILGTSLYNHMTSMAGIRDYLRRNVYADSRRVTEDLVRHYHAMAHQPGMQAAVRAFVAGRLNLDISYAFTQVRVPTLLAWGLHARQAPVADAEEFTDRNSLARLEVFEQSGMLPHDEEPEAFNQTLRAFLSADVESLRTA
jgi:pimeloyl-ACP methyl ester carboxylesterase